MTSVLLQSFCPRDSITVDLIVELFYGPLYVDSIRMIANNFHFPDNNPPPSHIFTNKFQRNHLQEIKFRLLNQNSHLFGTLQNNQPLIIHHRFSNPLRSITHTGHLAWNHSFTINTPPVWPTTTTMTKMSHFLRFPYLDDFDVFFPDPFHLIQMNRRRRCLA